MNFPQGEAAVGPLQCLSALLGEDVFFVPCEWGTRQPVACNVPMRVVCRYRKDEERDV